MELSVNFKLSSIYCYDEGDGIGDAEPYLWTIFFKIDGETIHQSGVKLDGQALFHFGPGSHRNLPNHDVGAGESVAIPAALGEWPTKLTPIVINDFSNNTYTIPGIAGVAVVLMEEDNVSDSGAEAGHQALNKFVQDSINNFISGISLLDFLNVDNPKDVLDQKIVELKNQITSQAEGIVHDAIVNKQPWYSDLWAWVNADDKIGSEIWMFDQDQIVQNHYQISFSQRWKNEGDWQIYGSVSAPNPCQPALNAVNQQKAVIKGIQDQIHALQTEMAHAAPALKKALQMEIKEVQQQLKPAQDKLATLEKNLALCYQRVSITGTIGALGTLGNVSVFKP